MFRLNLLILLVGTLLLATTFSAHGQAPTSMVYQGRLTDASGAPITVATSATFSIYTSLTGGAALWTESVNVSPDAQGLFTIELGSTTPLTTSTFIGSKRYMGIRVGSDPEMTPRQVIASVPYALSAGQAPSTAGGVTSISGGAGIRASPNPITSTGTLSISSNAITPSMIQGEAGVEFVSIGSSSSLPTTVRNLGSITMSIPTTGYVILQATCNAITFGGRTRLDFGVGTTSGTFVNTVGAGLLDGTDTIRRYFPMSVVAVVSASAGTRTYYVNAQKSSTFGVNSINLSKIYFTGIFVPTRY